MSEFFRLLFKHDFKVSHDIITQTREADQRQENNEAKVDFPDDEFDTIYRVCEFIYTGAYSVTTACPPVSSPTSPEAAKGDKLPESQGCKDVLDAQQIHLLTYCCAQKCDLSALQDYAYSRFVEITDLAEFTWDEPLISLVYNNTTHDDLGLRSFVTRNCIDHQSSVNKNAKLVEVIGKHEPLVWEMGKRLNARIAEIKGMLGKEVTLNEMLKTQLRMAQDKSADNEHEVASVRSKASKAVAEAEEKLAAAKMELSMAKKEIQHGGELATEMFKNLAGDTVCINCRRNDKVISLMREYNEDKGISEYLLKCDACRWFWWMKYE